jgi:transcriptional regulator with XRE-family HTH domain
MGKKQTIDPIERLRGFWQMHRQFDANMADLARYARVSRDTVYRWLNRKSRPKEQKLKLIQEWLNQRQNPANSSHIDP